MPSFTRTLETSIHAALSTAQYRGHAYSGLEHLLLALIDEPDARKLLLACNADLEELKSAILEYLEDEGSPLIPLEPDAESVPNSAFQRVVQRAAIHVQSSGRSEVTGANILVAIFAERESAAALFLGEQDITRYDAVNFIAHGVAKNLAYAEPRPLIEPTDATTFEPEELLLTEAEWRAREQAKRNSEPTSHPRQSSSEAEGSSVHSANGAADGKFTFVSYSSKDRALVRSIKTSIEGNGLSLWWDQDIQAGAEWRSEIKKNLNDASVVLTFWTPQSVDSLAVVEEASIAQSKKKLVHAKVEDCEIPYGFSETQYVDLRRWDGTQGHPDFQKLLYAINDRMALPNLEKLKARIGSSNPMEAVSRNGKIAIKDAPSGLRPELWDPAELETRLLALKTSTAAMCRMCSDSTAFQLPRALGHCLEVLSSSLSTEPVTWYALEDAKVILEDCMIDSFAADSWNKTVYRGAMNLMERVEQVRPYLQPIQLDPTTGAQRPPPPAPIVTEDDLEVVNELANRFKSEFHSADARATLDDNTIEMLDNAIDQISDAQSSAANDHKRFSRLRRALSSIVFVSSSVVAAIGTGVVVNLLTAPSAAATFFSRLRPIYEAVLRFFF
ncbi:toll/interleukin-1 receptor domain-containing protein [Vannielia litorea]|uniref:toll/interleukin-1 receptor domain-containing protein n=1 Tax=Vannielia litorea TaxID=1217970 RepID=UPI001C95777E|nr:toll/interleukin-1 receptor domain-containing protein [Vannielia litorea]MBY6047726.1 TIR domain-containing protein [Vannielia litorea]MBY6075140.1 TIR domain-containing protein [Vannielia litorea]